MLHHQFFQADNWSIHGTRCNDAQRVRDLDRKFVRLLFLIRNAEQSKGSRRRLRFPLGFNSSQFGFLHVAHFVAGFITQNNNRQNSSHTEAGSDSKGAFSEGEVTTFQHIPCADTEDEHCASHITRSYGVNEFHLSNRVKHQLGEAHHLHTHSFKVEIGRDWVLHPAVCNQNPQCGQV